MSPVVDIDQPLPRYSVGDSVTGMNQFIGGWPEDPEKLVLVVTAFGFNQGVGGLFRRRKIHLRLAGRGGETRCSECCHGRRNAQSERQPSLASVTRQQ